ncbi:MAG: extracellular solute-binding protein family 1, partial [Paenibacillus sp.]|nr:extracellular solute-binding protein family 1 [Paenibacillus sp.]
MQLKKWGIYGVAAICTLAVTACGNSGSKSEGGTDKPAGTAAVKPLEPVTLQFVGTNLNDQMFQDLIVKPLAGKYPHITVQQVKSTKLSELLSAGQTMDLYVNWAGELASNIELQSFTDITPMLKTHNWDMSRFDPKAIETARKVSGAGSSANVLYGLPYLVGLNALYYNKDIFNRFGVPYPKDGMTWDEAIELGKKLTRTENGVSYIGLDVDSYARMTFPLSLGVVNAATKKSIVNSDPYRLTLSTMKKIYDAQGIALNNPAQYAYGKAGDYFTKEKRTAMYGAPEGLLTTLKTTENMDWDVAQYPSYPSAMNKRGMYGMYYILPMKQS